MSAPHRLTRLLLFLCLAAVSDAAGQDAGLALEAGVGAALPMGSFSDGTRTGEGVTAGSSFSVAFSAPQSDRRSVYVGFRQHRFACEAAGCSTDDPYIATDFNLGMRIALLTGRAALPWVRLGAITTRVETKGLPAPDKGLSDLGFGGEVGLGVDFGVGRTVSIDPSVVYSAVNSKLPGGGLLRLRYLAAQMGISISF